MPGVAQASVIPAQATAMSAPVALSPPATGLARPATTAASAAATTSTGGGPRRREADTSSAASGAASAGSASTMPPAPAPAPAAKPPVVAQRVRPPGGSPTRGPGNVPAADAGALVVSSASGDVLAWGASGAAPGPGELIAVALTFQGRRKLVRHLSHTLVGEMIKLHPIASQPSRPMTQLVVVDRDGFEVGADVPLGTLARQAGSSGNGSVLELHLQVDGWGGSGGGGGSS